MRTKKCFWERSQYLWERSQPYENVLNLMRTLSIFMRTFYENKILFSSSVWLSISDWKGLMRDAAVAWREKSIAFWRLEHGFENEISMSIIFYNKHHCTRFLVVFCWMTQISNKIKFQVAIFWFAGRIAKALSGCNLSQSIIPLVLQQTSAKAESLLAREIFHLIYCEDNS